MDDTIDEYQVVKFAQKLANIQVGDDLKPILSTLTQEEATFFLEVISDTTEIHFNDQTRKSEMPMKLNYMQHEAFAFYFKMIKCFIPESDPLHESCKGSHVSRLWREDPLHESCKGSDVIVHINEKM